MKMCDDQTTPTLRVDADFESIRAIGPWLRTALDRLGPPASDSAGSIELAIHELATNAIDHAESTCLQFDAQVSETTIEITLRDDGSPFAGRSTPAPTPSEPQIRGYGLMIVEALAETIDYERADPNNIWTVRFTISA